MTGLYLDSRFLSSSIGSPLLFLVFPFSVIWILPFLDLKITEGSDPKKLYLPHFSPPSTLSSKKEYFPDSIFLKADTGVSKSASTSCQTGIKFPFLSFFLNSVNEGEIMWRKDKRGKTKVKIMLYFIHDQNF